MNWRVTLAAPEVDEATIRAVADVLRGRTLSIGPRLEGFETSFTRYIGARHAIGVNSGTSGLHLAVRVLGLEPGDEVVTSPFSFVASSNCLLFENVKPRFVDVDPETLLMDLDATEEIVASGASVASAGGRPIRGLLPVHVFGNAVDMPRLRRMAREHDLVVIEDACEAIGGGIPSGDEAVGSGGTPGERKLGAWGDCGVFGFYPNKQMTTGEGGMVVTDSDELAARIASLRNQGRSPSGDGSFTDLGYNYRMSEITAALGECQLKRLDDFVARRKERERRYHELLGDIEEIRLLPLEHPNGGTRSPFVFIVQSKSETLRDAMAEHLRARGVQCAIYFRSIHLEPYYRERFGYREGMFPRSEHASSTCLAVPFSSVITEDEQHIVADAIREAVVNESPTFATRA